MYVYSRIQGRRLLKIKREDFINPRNALGFWICGFRCILESSGSQNSRFTQYQKPQNQRVQKVRSQRSAGSCTRCTRANAFPGRYFCPFVPRDKKFPSCSKPQYFLCQQLTFTFVFETRLLNWAYFFGSFSFIPRNLSGVRNSGNSHFSNFADARRSHSNK